MERRGSWRERARDPALTALLTLQCFILLVAAPAAAMGYWGGRLAFEASALLFAVVVFVIADGPVATTISILAIACGVVATTWRQIWAVSIASSLLAVAGALTADVLIIYLIGRAVLAPGEITRYRVLGAIALYLGLGMLFANAYRLSWELVPDLYGAFPVKRLFWVALTVFCSEWERPFFVPSPAIRFAERAEGVKGPKR